jgi:uncharacterized membrane protein (DUF4010 family)
MGGLASTTAATVEFAHNVADEPSKTVLYSRATVIANAIQFPRVLALLYVVNPALAATSVAPLAVMTVAGLASGLLIGRTAVQEPATGTLRIGNPFRLMVCAEVRSHFTAILFATKAAAVRGGRGSGLLDQRSRRISGCGFSCGVGGGPGIGRQAPSR